MLSGPSLLPVSGKARHLVVFLHGYGADGNDLIGIGRAWQNAFPDTAFVSPHAPEPCDGAPYGRQWFPLTFRHPNERWEGVCLARSSLDDYLDAQLHSLGLAENALALVGFSQGTMMALHTGLRRRASPAAIIGYSGVLVRPDGVAAEAVAPDISSRPPVLLVHGDQDEVIPPQALDFSAHALKAYGISVSTCLCPGLGHGIDNEGLLRGARFLETAFSASQ